MNSNSENPSEIESLRAQIAALERENSRLRDSALRLERLSETNVLGILVLDENSRVLDVNESFLQMLGFSLAEFKALDFNWHDLVPRSQWSQHEKKGRLLWESGVCPAWETCFLRTDGAELPVLTGAAIVTTELRQCVLWALDISDLKSAQAALRESEFQSRAILENLREGVILTALDDTVAYVNPRMCEMSGFSREEFLGRRAHEVLLPPEDWAAHRTMLERREQGIADEYQIQLRRKDGSSWWAQVFGSPLLNSHGEIVGTLGVQTDVTQAKTFTEQLAQSNRELQAFAYAVSHDLKEPLRKIEAFGSRLERGDGEKISDEGRDYLRRMRSAASRMFGLIDGLLEYSRVATMERPFGDVPLERVCLEAISDLEIAIEKSGARVELRDLPTLRGDATLLRQLMQNLLANALRYRREGVAPEICVEGFSGEHSVGFRVRDNGQGFEAEAAEKIFEIFARLDPSREGSGVGLTICRKIVERHGGTIRAEGAPEQGAIFTLEFPATGREARRDARSAL